MSLRSFRVFLYISLAILSVVTLGLGGAIVHITSYPEAYAEAITVELISAGILSLFWSFWGTYACFFNGGPLASYLSELICLFTLSVMYLTGVCIATAPTPYYRSSPYGHFFCKIIQGECVLGPVIFTFGWINWVWTIFLIVASVASLISGKHRITDQLHGKRGEDDTEKKHSAPVLSPIPAMSPFTFLLKLLPGTPSSKS